MFLRGPGSGYPSPANSFRDQQFLFSIPDQYPWFVDLVTTGAELSRKMKSGVRNRLTPEERLIRPSTAAVVLDPGASIDGCVGMS
jgi:hypothetical protein